MGLTIFCRVIPELRPSSSLMDWVTLSFSSLILLFFDNDFDGVFRFVGVTVTAFGMIGCCWISGMFDNKLVTLSGLFLLEVP